MTDDDFATFVAQHEAQLRAAGVPELFWRSVAEKLRNEVFDAGEFFTMVCDESATAGAEACDDGGGGGGDRGAKSTSRWSVLARSDISPSDPNHIFLVDHAWTFRASGGGLGAARQQLETHPQLLRRLAEMFDLLDEDDESPTKEEDEEGEDGNDDDDEERDGEPRVEEPETPKWPSEAARSDGPSTSAESPKSAAAATAVDSGRRNGKVIDAVLRELWRHVDTYSVRYEGELSEESLPVWYVLDEFGTRVGWPRSGSKPNSRLVPILYAPTHTVYSLLFAVDTIREDEEVTRQHESTIVRTRPHWLPYVLLPWQRPANFDELLQAVGEKAPPPAKEHFRSGRTGDALPRDDQENRDPAGSESRHFLDGGRKLKVYADDTQLLDQMKRVQFEEVDDWHDADLLWLRRHFHDFDKLSAENPRARVNQFPNEDVLTVKDLFASAVLHRFPDGAPDWFETTYNLHTDLPHFVAHFERRRRTGADNTWIVKPWNLARGYDMTVTRDLTHIIRLVDTGPKIACKYIERPVLFRRPDSGRLVKFDLRFIVLLESVRPLRARVYSRFWIRFALNDFSLEKLDDHETHFTVFNYVDAAKVLNMDCAAFVEHFEEQYADKKIEWKDVQAKINHVLKEALVTATCAADQPFSVAADRQSRAIYGADVMLKWSAADGEGKSDVQPVLLEWNFMPDCTRACRFYADFADTLIAAVAGDDPIDEAQLPELV